MQNLISIQSSPADYMEYFYAIEPLSPSARISIQAKVGTPIKDKGLYWYSF